EPLVVQPRHQAPPRTVGQQVPRDHARGAGALTGRSSMDMPVSNLRRKRHPYPAPVIELALALAAQRPVRDVAHLLDIPPSVIYRWRGTADSRAAAQPAALADLVSRCGAHGFNFAIEALHDVAVSAPQDSAQGACSADARPPGRVPARYVFDARRERAS